MEVECLECKGKGWYVPKGEDFRVECYICGGTGSFNVPTGKKLCPDCKGRGLVPMDTGMGFLMEVICDKCGKTGFVDEVE